MSVRSARPLPPLPFFSIARPMVLGHRGAAAHVPENTLESFRRSIALGAHVIESDVQVTRDGVPVLLHDAELDRTTDGTGPVEALTLDAVKLLDAGYHFGIDDRGSIHPDAKPSHRGEGLQVPALEEAFRTLPEAAFNLEIKTRTPGVVARIVDLIQEYERVDRTLLAAGDDQIRAEIHSELATRKVAAATSASLSEIVAVVRSAVAGDAPPADVRALQIPTEFGANPLVTPELIAHARTHGIQIHVWTINDPAEMTRLLDLGVDGLVTDFPGRAAELIAQRG